ncbi:hypothetical protein [Myxococcus sp. Y35]|uniref:hypothetical protein n=1 Tax=Pseudomyxococcus flavus TaxID=3115648 RepID=UPI003CF6297E
MRELIVLLMAACLGCSSGSTKPAPSDAGVDPQVTPPQVNPPDESEARPNFPGLDVGFGDDGLFRLGYDGALAALYRIARQPDGKLVGVGFSREGVLVVRILPSGAMDLGFGRNGVVQIPTGQRNGSNNGYGCAIQPDGKILVASPFLRTNGGQGLQPRAVGLVARLEADGRLDASFGDGGLVVHEDFQTASALALLGDGKIVVGGLSTIHRLLADGSADPSFGTAGRTALPRPMRIVDMAITSAGAILAAGDAYVVRVTASGALDTSFGEEGYVRGLGTSSSGRLSSILLDAGGGFVVGGAVGGTGPEKLWIERFHADGSPDDGFAGGAIGVSGAAMGLGRDASGNIIASGFVQLDENIFGRSARFDADGNLDPSFGNAGVGAHSYNSALSNVVVEPDGSFTAAGVGVGGQQGVLPSWSKTSADGTRMAEGITPGGGSFDSALAVTTTADGGILIAGITNGTHGAAIVRLDENGAQDVGFGYRGSMTYFPNFSRVRSIAEGPGGSVLVSGTSDDRAFPSGFVVERRVAESGELDPSFGQQGIAGGPVVGDLPATSHGMTTAPDGTIYVFGQTLVREGESVTEFGVIALDGEGNRLPSFGDGGAATTAFGEPGSGATHAAVQPDGKLVVLGVRRATPVLVRFNTDGTLDTDFGAIEVSNVPEMKPMAVAVQDDGAVLAVAATATGAVDIVRVGPSGALDTSFGTGGVVSETFGGNDYALQQTPMGLTLLPDGKISLALASAAAPGLVEHGLLMRYLSDGRRDPGFGTNGRQDVIIGSGSTALHATTLDASGRLVLVGRTWTTDGGSEFMAIRVSL